MNRAYTIFDLAVREALETIPIDLNQWMSQIDPTTRAWKFLVGLRNSFQTWTTPTKETPQLAYHRDFDHPFLFDGTSRRYIWINNRSIERELQDWVALRGQFVSDEYMTELGTAFMATLLDQMLHAWAFPRLETSVPHEQRALMHEDRNSYFNIANKHMRVYQGQIEDEDWKTLWDIAGRAYVKPNFKDETEALH